MKTLIVKLGASGDIVRTTVLLNELKGDIYWLTSNYNTDLLKSKKIKKFFVFENASDLEELGDMEFDLLLSLDEEKTTLEFLRNIKAKKLIGHFLDEEGKVDYTTECDYWLDMSMVSKKYLQDEANRLKFLNNKSIPEIITELVFGEGSWKGQEYDLGLNPKPLEEVKGVVGLIDVTEGKWPNKYWSGYKELKLMLEQEGYKVISLRLRPTLGEHIDDINNCELIVCGDTLGMHLALALRKKVVAIFNCTPPNEIYSYGLMKKMVSPLLSEYFLKRTNDEEAQTSVSVKEVYKAVKELLDENNKNYSKVEENNKNNF